MSDTKFRCFENLDYTYTNIALNTTTQNKTVTSGNYIRGAAEVTLSKNTYEKCYIADYGGVWRFEDTPKVTEDTSVYETNLAIYGGCFSAANSTIDIKSSVFKYNNASNGAVFHMEKSSSLTMTNN